MAERINGTDPVGGAVVAGIIGTDENADEFPRRVHVRLRLRKGHRLPREHSVSKRGRVPVPVAPLHELLPRPDLVVLSVEFVFQLIRTSQTF